MRGWRRGKREEFEPDALLSTSNIQEECYFETFLGVTLEDSVHRKNRRWQSLPESTYALISDYDKRKWKRNFIEIFVHRKPSVPDVVRGTLTNVKVLYRDKDASISRVKRLEGFQIAREGQHEKALLLFSQAILRAPITGKCKTVDRGFSLPLALLGRAETFMLLKEYHLALEDLELAEEYEPPKESRVTLEIPNMRHVLNT
ncbi:hypothetical protein HZH66_014501 [Vespula vulgaris]|uniref:Uncharacterized protein n=1 Tax=Vespula vulgaris TaxID=7454 RepID=A0A834J6X1_VESVU|nr:hypothetical protein HZH66_014501 [Vespula vulgaris]